METSRGDAAAATWIFHGDESRRRRGRDVDIPWRRVAATPRPQRGYSVETSRGDAAAAMRTFREDEHYAGTTTDAPASSADQSTRTNRAARTCSTRQRNRCRCSRRKASRSTTEPYTPPWPRRSPTPWSCSRSSRFRARTTAAASGRTRGCLRTTALALRRPNTIFPYILPAWTVLRLGATSTTTCWFRSDSHSPATERLLTLERKTPLTAGRRTFGSRTSRP